VFGKLLASRFMFVDNNPVSVADAFINLVWHTDASPAISIWYMFIVFLATLITPLLFWLGRGNSLVPLAAAAALFYFGLPHYVFADRFAEYFLFFVLGGMAADSGERWLQFVDRSHWLATGLLAISIGWLFWLDSFSPHWSHLLCGSIALPALHGLVRSRWMEHSRILAFLGSYSFVIYLLNTPVMGLEKGILLKWLSWDGPGFLVQALLMLIGGLVVPVLIKKFVFSRWRYLDRLTD
jgi:membrane-bound acyltransferase YfiQ involved in biofilm formation